MFGYYESSFLHFVGNLRCFVVGAGDLSASEPTSSTHSTLIHSLVGSDHLIAAGLHTLALDAH